MLGVIHNFLYKRPDKKSVAESARQETQDATRSRDGLPYGCEPTNTYAWIGGIQGQETRHAKGSASDFLDDDNLPSVGLHGLVSRPEVFTKEEKEFNYYGDGDNGYHDNVARIRREEFRRFRGQVYLDYAGAALYSERQIQECAEELMGQLMCNPHSAPSSISGDALANLRRETLAFLNADGRDYDVVITGGATAALKIVAECFPWSPGASRLAHPVAVHNSVLGMRGPAMAAGAAVQLVQLSSSSSSPYVEVEAEAEADAAAGPDAGPYRGGGEWAGGPGPVVAAGPPMRASTPAAAAAVAGVAGGGPAAAGPPYNLLALPVECNFTGDREPLGAVVRHVRRHGLAGAAGGGPARGEAEQRCEGEGASEAADAVRGCGDGGGCGGGRWLVLLDAAKACATAPPNLSAVPADFVVLSYYKIFGHPTGLGALVARKSALALLSPGKSYFGGGTVEVAVADQPYQVRRPGPAGFEDGTPPFTAIAAARHGFDFLRRLGGLPAVHRHTTRLARWLATRLASLRHANGAPVCVLYGKWCAAVAAAAAAEGHASTAHRAGSGPESGSGSGSQQAAAAASAPSTASIPVQSRAGGASRPPAAAPDHGPTLAFNLLRPDGSWVGYAEVGRLATMHGLHLRTGCFCNPGACASWLGLSAEDVIRHHRAGHVCWDDHDLVDGRPTGAVRVSLGAVSTFSDVFALVELVRKYFVEESERGGDGDAAGPAAALLPTAPTLSPTPITAAPAAGDAAAVAAAAVAAVGMWERTLPPQLLPAAAATATATAAVAAALSEPSSQLPHPGGQQPLAEQPALTRRQERVLEDGESCAAGGGGGGEQGSRQPEGAVTGSVAGVGPGVSRGTDCGGSSGGVDGGAGGAGGGRLSGILLYPVKSCAPQVVEAWPVGPTGLLYDREWALVDDSGVVVTLKQCPRMALIAPFVDLTRGTLTITAPPAAAVSPLELSIPGLFNPREGTPESIVAEAAEAEAETGGAVRRVDAVRLDAGLTMERVQVCGDTVCSDLMDVCQDTTGESHVREWFARVLGAPCRIVRQRTGARKVRRPAGRSGQQGAAAAAAAAATSRGKGPGGGGGAGGTDPAAGEGGGGGGDAAAEPAVGFANDGQYLLVSEESMVDLRTRIVAAEAKAKTDHTVRTEAAPLPRPAAAAKNDDLDLVARFRPNLVVSGFLPYEEDGWRAVQVGPLAAGVLGTCPRCELLQVDPRVGVRRGSEVLVALAQYRRRGGRVQFGVLLAATGGTAGSTAPAAPQSNASEQRGAGGNQDGVNESPPGEATEGPGDGEEGVPAAATEAEAAAAAPGSAEWLRWRFGRSAVVAIGDRVMPTMSGVGTA